MRVWITFMRGLELRTDRGTLQISRARPGHYPCNVSGDDDLENKAHRDSEHDAVACPLHTAMS